MEIKGIRMFCLCLEFKVFILKIYEKLKSFFLRVSLRSFVKDAGVRVQNNLWKKTLVKSEEKGLERGFNTFFFEKKLNTVGCFAF